jgi:hypothetical protein
LQDLVKDGVRTRGLRVVKNKTGHRSRHRAGALWLSGRRWRKMKAGVSRPPSQSKKFSYF